MGFMVFKSTGLDSPFQRKNQFWKICTESRDITKKGLKIALPNQTSKNWHILGDISGLGAFFSKPIFALKSWVRAGRFEYHEPHNPNNFFSLIKGSEPFCPSSGGAVNGFRKLWKFTCVIYLPQRLGEKISRKIWQLWWKTRHPSLEYKNISLWYEMAKIKAKQNGVSNLKNLK